MLHQMLRRLCTTEEDTVKVVLLPVLSVGSMTSLSSSENTPNRVLKAAFKIHMNVSR